MDNAELTQHDRQYVRSFSSTIKSMAVMAYNSGVLQRHPLVICGVEISMVMRDRFNTLTVTFQNTTLTVTLWDCDSDELTETSIELTIDLALR